MRTFFVAVMGTDKEKEQKNKQKFTITLPAYSASVVWAFEIRGLIIIND